MRSSTVLALRVVLAVLLAGSLFLQVVMVPLVARDIDVDGGDVAAWQPTALLTVVVLGVLAAQVVLVCVWRLLTFVRRGSVFSDASFRYVDTITGAVAAGSVLLFAAACVLAPGEAAAPGIVLIVCGASLAVLGVALLTAVLRALLAQAVAREVEVVHLRSELDAVV